MDLTEATSSTAVAIHGNSMSLQSIIGSTLSQNVQLSAELTSWLSSCPDPTTVEQMMRLHMWLEGKHLCECGEWFQRKELRFDIVGPFSDGQDLICESCWDFFCEPTPARPKRRTTPWPATLDIRNGGRDLTYKGEIRLKGGGPVIGKVTKYNPACHTGSVVLYAMEAHDRAAGIDKTPPELGSLDPSWEVVSSKSNKVVKRRHTLVEEVVAELPDPEQELIDNVTVSAMTDALFAGGSIDLRTWVNDECTRHAAQTRG